MTTKQLSTSLFMLSEAQIYHFSSQTDPKASFQTINVHSIFNVSTI